MPQPFVTEIVQRLAPRIGARVTVEPEYGFVGQITFSNGRKTFFRNTNFNINRLGSVEIARDKGYSRFFLKHLGYRVTEAQTFFSEALCRNLTIKRTIDDGFRFAGDIGFPVIVKPNSLSQGALVSKVCDKRGFFRAARAILRRVHVMLVERFYEGADYRLVVLDDEVISAYQRIPLAVIGDGSATVRELLLLKQERFVREGRDTVIDLDDFRIAEKLRRRGLSLASVLPDLEHVYLLDNANLSTGGDARDVTPEVHPTFRDLAVRITRDMGLRLCGVDLICEDITMPVGDYVILEVNGAPGLDNYACLGARQAALVDDLYLRVLQAIERGPRE